MEDGRWGVRRWKMGDGPYKRSIEGSFGNNSLREHGAIDGQIADMQQQIQLIYNVSKGAL